MNFEEFIKVVKQEVKQKVGITYSVTVNSVLKVNRELHGVSVGLHNASIMPSVYLEEFYTEYLMGKCINQIVEEIIEVSQRRKLGKDLCSINIMDYEWVKPRLRVKLVNYARNEKLLQTVPYEAILDLAIVPYIQLLEGEEMATIMVKLTLMDQWNVTKEALLSAAKENTVRDEPVVIERISDFIFDKLLNDIENNGDGIRDDNQFMKHLAEEQPTDKCEMYIISNRRNINGAYVAFQQDHLSKLATKLGVDKLYVLPSSIHEVIAIPAGNFPVEHLREMVEDVNRTMVSEEEFLSDEVYMYQNKPSEVMKVCN